jgi:hypothetical protein
MSLVNDALKRATEAQKSTSPVPARHLPLRPVEPAQLRKNGIGLVLPATLLTILVAAMFSLGLVNQKSRSAPSQPQTQLAVQTVMAASSIAAPVPQVTVTPNSAVTPANSAVAPTPSSVASIQENPATSPPPSVVELTPPKPAPLKLQAVFFTPPKPLAIINGKRVHVGDLVRELQVVAIGSASAMLIGPGQTNFLTLE